VVSDVRSARRRLAPFLRVGVAGLAVIVTPGSARAALYSARNGSLASFSGGISQVNATFAAVSDRYRSDTQTFAATYSGSGGPGVAQGTFNVRWRRRQSVTYGAAFYLPPSFHAATQGQQALIRWDSLPGSGGRFFEGGVVVDYSDNSAYLMSATVSGATVTQRLLAGPFPLPIGSWFTLQVRQLLGSGSAAFSEVYENGKLVATSRAPNFPGWQIHHVSYGIVQLSGGAEQGAASLELDQATVGGYTGYVNPLGGDRYITGRTDMGVDFCLTPGEPIRAVGDGVVVGISPDWFRYQPYIWYQLIDGPDAGRYVYVAEQINRLPRIGAQIAAGQPIAYYKRAGTCLETGWSAADGATLAQATTGYHEGQVTRAGVQFARFLGSMGVRGPFELAPTHGAVRRYGALDPAPAAG
jgi:hypothetical protein